MSWFHKYKVSPPEQRTYEGVVFDSKAEMKRWIKLREMEAAGRIEKLRRQVPYELKANGWLICVYVADFVYFDDEGREVVEDIKGMRLADYQIKRKLMFACHGVTISEVKAR